MLGENVQVPALLPVQRGSAGGGVAGYGAGLPHLVMHSATVSAGLDQPYTRPIMNWFALAAVVVAALSAGASAASAIAAWRNIVAQSKIRRAEVEAARPYFTIEEAYVRELERPATYPHRMTVEFRNVGTRPAFNFRLQFATFEQDAPDKLADFYDWWCANDIPGGSKLTYRHDAYWIGNSQETKYILLTAQYDVPPLNNTYVQPFYMSWRGVIGGVETPEVMDVSIVEQDHMREFIQRVRPGMFLIGERPRGLPLSGLQAEDEC